ncbi:MAG TPA: histidinol-phosphate transaminase [Candidatus Eisenbergiella intestinipullorum]|nr:histidinol-phosphate transaminase [Candidatus Eisenbergiella intestinipullorum]
MIKDLVRPEMSQIMPYVAGRTVEQAQKDNGGIPMIKLGSNENQLGPSPKAVQAMIDIVSGTNTYPDPQAGDLREKLAEYYGIKPDHVVCANGSSTILEAICKVFVCPQDEVIYCQPTFQIYGMFARQQGGVPVVLPLDKDLKFDLPAMKAAVTDKTKLVMICNPNNPTASYLGKEELETFIRELPEHVICVIDEAYLEFATAEDCVSMLPLIDRYNVIVVRTFSKIWGLAGARVGYSMASAEISAYLSNAICAFNVNKIVIAAAKASLEDKEFLKASWENNREGKKYLTEELTKFGWKVWPSQSSFLYVTETGMDPKEIAAGMEKRGIIIRGNLGYLRISIGTMEQSRKMVAAFQDLLGK